MFETENGFYKKAANRTTNTRVLDNGEILTCDSIKREYEAALRLHQAEQEYFPHKDNNLFIEPYSLKNDKNGLVNGYEMEKLEGETLKHYINPERPGEINNINTDNITSQLEQALEVITEYREPHGDLEPWNIMIDNSSNIKLFDPVGYPEDFDWKEGQIRKDQTDIEEIIDELTQMETELVQEAI